MEAPLLIGLTALTFPKWDAVKTSEMRELYINEHRPLVPLGPPPWVFGLVWTTLYFLFIWASYNTLIVGHASTYYVVNLFMVLFYTFANKSWTLVFYEMRWLLGGLIMCFAMIPFLVVLIVNTFRETTIVSLVPGVIYSVTLAWVCFATYMNLVIYLRSDSTAVKMIIPVNHPIPVQPAAARLKGKNPMVTPSRKPGAFGLTK